MSATTAAWLALGFPLAGTIINGLLHRSERGARLAGVVGTAVLAISLVRVRGRRLLRAAGP